MYHTLRSDKVEFFENLGRKKFLVEKKILVEKKKFGEKKFENRSEFILDFTNGAPYQRPAAHNRHGDPVP